MNTKNDGKKNTKDDRNEFNSNYEINKLSLYLRIENVTEEILDIANYQTFLGKNYYGILRRLYVLIF